MAGHIKSAITWALERCEHLGLHRVILN